MSKEMIAVREERGLRTLHFGPDWIQAAMRIGRPDTLVLDYTRAMMAALLLQPRPRSALIIGLGAGSFAKFLYRHYPETRITVVEINPRVIDVARECFYLPDDPARLSIHVADGFEFVQESKRQFDLLLVDGFDRNGRAGALESLPFYLSCHARLSQRGVMAANLFGGWRGFKAAVKRIDAAFSGRVLRLACCADRNVVLFGLRGPVPNLTAAQFQQRAQALKAETKLDVAFTLPELVKSI
jgi:spermidine synthase